MDVSDRAGWMSKASPLIEEALAKAETEEQHALVIEATAKAIGATVEEAGPLIAKNLRKLAPQMIREHRKIRTRFERHLRDVWGEALDAYYAVYVASLEMGEAFNAEHRPAAVDEQDFVFEALVGLHTRCCLVASEIYALLSSGHASGAMARWRTMHECAVYSAILGNEGRKPEYADLAERYVSHDFVINQKDVFDYQTYSTRLGYEPLEPDELKEMQDFADSLVQRFGKVYKTDNGWAHPLLPKEDRIQFRQLEQLAKLDHLRPFYGIANHDIHADSKGARLNLQDYRGGQIRLVGPSNAQLSDPGSSAVISLNQTTVALILNGRPEIMDVSDVPMLHALGELVEDACSKFIDAHNELERREAEVVAEINQELLKDSRGVTGC